MIAIDFGTTNCSIAIFAEGDTAPRIQLLEYGDPDSLQATVMPSALSECRDLQCKNQRFTYGHEALRHYYGTSHDISLLQEMKLYYDRTTQEPATLVETSEVTIVRQEGGFISTIRKPVKQLIYEGDVPLKPSEFVPGTTNLIRNIMQRAQVTLDDKRDAAFGVPASFKDAGKKRLREAAKRAVVGDAGNYDNVHIFPEPLAAARAYMGIGVGNTLVLDYGGGTLDISVISIDKSGKFDQSKVAFGGFSEGGSRMDAKLLEYCLDKAGPGLTEWYRTQNVLARRRIKSNVEAAKIQMSIKPDASVALPGAPVPLVSLNHADLALAFSDITTRMAVKITEVVAASVGKIENINFVVLSGGTSLNRQVQDAVLAIFRHIPEDRFVVPDASKPEDVERCLCAVAKGLAWLRNDNFPDIDFGDR